MLGVYCFDTGCGNDCLPETLTWSTSTIASFTFNTHATRTIINTYKVDTNSADITFCVCVILKMKKPKIHYFH